MTNCNRKIQEAPDHYPETGDQVHLWLEFHRDGLKKGTEGYAMYTLLIDEYQLAADTQRSLENMVNAQWQEEQNRANPQPAKKKKPARKKKSDG